MAPYTIAQTYPSYPQTLLILNSAEQNHLLTQRWLWVPHMKCSLHNDLSPGAIYLIHEVTWNGSVKIFRLKQLSNSSSKRDSYREVSESELKVPSTSIEDIAVGSLTGQRIPTTAGRRESVGSAGRSLGIGLASEGVRYRVGAQDTVVYQHHQQPQQQLAALQLQQQCGGLGYPSGFAFGGGNNRHRQQSGLENGFLDDERDGSGSGNGRERRQDRDRDDRRGHGKDKGRPGKGSGKQRNEKEKDRGRRGSLSSEGRSDGSGRR